MPTPALPHRLQARLESCAEDLNAMIHARNLLYARGLPAGALPAAITDALHAFRYDSTTTLPDHAALAAIEGIINAHISNPAYRPALHPRTPFSSATQTMSLMTKNVYPNR